jgi:hypothetical protein
MPRYLGKCDCQQCGREADAYENAASMAYYNCGPCGVRVQQKSARGNALFMKGVRRDAEPDDNENSREKPEIHAVVPAVKSPEKPAKRGLLANTIFGG